MSEITKFCRVIIFTLIITSVLLNSCDDSPTKPNEENQNSPTAGTGEVQVINNLGYSVGVYVDDVYSAHLSGGNYFVKMLSIGEHSVRVYNTSNSSTYSISISKNSLTTLNHSNWQNSNGASSPQDLLRVNNNISFSVNVDVDGIYRAKIGGNKHWGLRLNVGDHTVKIYTSTGYSRTYNVTINSDSDYILNHNSW